MARLLIASIAVLAFAGTAEAANVNAGKAVFQSQCSICHGNTASSPPGVGPRLFGVMGRMAGTLPGFAYSSAMKKVGKPWTADRLDTYIEAPQKTIPGIIMPYPGLKDAGQRGDLIAYLASLK